MNVVCGLGDKSGPEWVREYGVSGWTSYTVNYAPSLCKEIELASLAGDTARVQALGHLSVFKINDLRARCVPNVM